MKLKDNIAMEIIHKKMEAKKFFRQINLHQEKNKARKISRSMKLKEKMKVRKIYTKKTRQMILQKKMKPRRIPKKITRQMSHKKKMKARRIPKKISLVKTIMKAKN